MEKLLLPLLIVALVSCGDGKADAARKLAEQAQEQGLVPNVLDLTAFDMPLTVALPENATPDQDSVYAKADWNEEFGEMRVSAGEHFGLTIKEMQGDIARLKADLERDMLRKHSILEEAPDRLIYRSEYPDDTLVFIHFYRIITVQGRTFVVEDMSAGRYNEAEVKRMVDAVGPAQQV